MRKSLLMILVVLIAVYTMFALTEFDSASVANAETAVNVIETGTVDTDDEGLAVFHTYYEPQRKATVSSVESRGRTTYARGTLRYQYKDVNNHKLNGFMPCFLFF